MFTGLIERTGKVLALTSSVQSITRLELDVGPGFETALGDSVAVNGTCLTVTSNEGSQLAFDLNAETIRLTSFSALRVGSEVNLERAMRIGDRLGGHLVSGHVDGLGTIAKIDKTPQGWDLHVRLPRHLARYVIAKGSICLDGVSLTVNTVTDDAAGTMITLMLIPTTISVTAFKGAAEGQPLNAEVDQIGKYIERLLGPRT